MGGHFGPPWGAFGRSWDTLGALWDVTQFWDPIFRVNVAEPPCLRTESSLPELVTGFSGNGAKPGRSGPGFTPRRGSGLREFITRNKLPQITYDW